MNIDQYGVISLYYYTTYMGLFYKNSTWFFRILVDFENCTISTTRGKLEAQKPQKTPFLTFLDNFEILKF